MNRRILAMISLSLLVVAGYFYLQQDNPASSSGEALAAVKVPALSGTALDGEKAFNANCASCHGKIAAGRDGLAPPLVHKIYEPSHHGDMSFVLAVKQGVRQHHWSFGNMPPVAAVADNEIADIISYVRTLQRANGIQ